MPKVKNISSVVLSYAIFEILSPSSIPVIITLSGPNLEISLAISTISLRVRSRFVISLPVKKHASVRLGVVKLDNLTSSLILRQDSSLNIGYNTPSSPIIGSTTIKALGFSSINLETISI